MGKSLLLIACCALLIPTTVCQETKPKQPVAHSPDDLTVIPATGPYHRITGNQRIEWAAIQTFGPESLLTGTFSAGLGTARNAPREYEAHWDGFAKRYGMRFTGVASSNVIEAGLGALWGEDPRYVRVAQRPFKARVANVFVMTFAARSRSGRLIPSYARYIAIPGNNFLSNTWRVPSESTTSDALKRTGFGLLADVASNAWDEFWPDAKKLMFTRR